MRVWTSAILKHYQGLSIFFMGTVLKNTSKLCVPITISGCRQQIKPKSGNECFRSTFYGN